MLIIKEAVKCFRTAAEKYSSGVAYHNLGICYENGFGVSFGRLREDAVFDWKFVGLSHNTIRGAAGGAVLSAELLVAQKYITAK